MSNLHTLLVLVPALPLAACLITAVFGKHVLKQQSHWPVVIALAASFAASVLLLGLVRNESEAETNTVGWSTTVDLWTWAHIDHAQTTPPLARSAQGSASQLGATVPLNIPVTLRADPLTAIMLCMVTFVSTLVAIYSSGYMHGDPGYWRFFSYIALFVFSMTMLVSVSNFVLLYVFWEAVGACSYLLIGFWFQKPEAVAAGKKAFLVNRVGDFGFALAVFLIWTTYGTLNFHDAGGIAGVLGQTRLADPSSYASGAIATAICLLLMLGACGKSAQFPLHVWLPDAMEGPTPVSALIHAATMVTAGVYMVTRCTPLFVASPDAQQVVAVVGGFTALLAGVIALTQNDLKRVLAYSTISQLGYMFLGLGVGTLAGITAGMFHLFTHAFFKALLFLGAGSVMHGMGGIIDIRRFGGLRRILPTTHWTFLFGCLALAGIIPFAGFWSKDAILSAVSERGHESMLYRMLFYGAVLSAFLTAIYTFRAYFLTFFGEERVPPEAGHHAHESPFSITIPLIALAICSLVVGAYFELTHRFADFLHRTPSLAFERVQATGHEEFNAAIATVSTLVALAGIGLAAFFYLGDRRQVQWLAGRFRVLYELSHQRLFIDQLYNALFVWPLWLLARLSYSFDRYVIDGIVNLFGRLPVWTGAALRALQSGMVQFYAFAMIFGLLVLIATLMMLPAAS